VWVASKDLRGETRLECSLAIDQKAYARSLVPDVAVTGYVSQRGKVAFAVVFAATVGQLLLAVLAPDLPQFAGKAFGARLIFYPVMMLLPVVAWLVTRRVRGITRVPPWAGFALIAAPFLVDVTGNTFDMYDSIWWWDDANHYFNWLLLCLGAGILIERGCVRPRWALAVLITGLGSLLAVLWELGEWYTFIRHSSELSTAYEDTLGDEALGSLGGLTAALILVWWRREAASPG
jgi:hypothetical protein